MKNVTLTREDLRLLHMALNLAMARWDHEADDPLSPRRAYAFDERLKYQRLDDRLMAQPRTRDGVKDE